MSLSSGLQYSKYENISLKGRITNITVDFSDISGIKSANIYFENATSGTAVWVGQPMINLTALDPAFTQATFNVTLPALNFTSDVHYFFETEDFNGNKANSTMNSYHVDATGPVLTNFTTHPLAISNQTDVILLYNATDAVGIDSSKVWYSYNNGGRRIL